MTPGSDQGVTVEIDEFIAARLDEEGRSSRLDCNDVHPQMDVYHPDGHEDPRVTARVEGLRKTVDVLTSAASLNPEHDLARLTGAMALRHVASIWRTHPDYREEWAQS